MVLSVDVSEQLSKMRVLAGRDVPVTARGAMLKCLCCGRRGSQGSGEDGEGGAPPDDQEESPCEAGQDAVDAAVVEDAAPVTTPPPPTTTTTTTSPPAPAKMRNLNALGLRVDASVDAELAELGMDASVLLEPLTPRSLMTSTPYPGKRASVVLDAVRGGALDGLLPDSPDDEEELPPDALPALAPREPEGTREPPATPVGRDELALRRHRFFSDLLTAAQAAADHRVRFDPRGPVVAGGYSLLESATPAL
ncbi:hypothetical protein ONE63_003894 [Megalurothrips usitatus]|uniref:Uncharacterized protein n=1 Tax=Megalurothrips usitatus TaxID=439358 RepID=A0AAV7X7H5_9NEOP|nr:hypothetical protein ONE63_003894 [Megalurothrips usitatus]